MTIRFEHLDIRPATDTDVRPREAHDRDVTTSYMWQQDILAMVRHIVRETLDVNMVPRVLRVVHGAVDDFGNDTRIEVQYNTCGWRAVWACRMTDDGPVGMTCYMN